MFHRYIVLLMLCAMGCTCADAKFSTLKPDLVLTCGGSLCTDIDFGTVEVGGSAERSVSGRNTGKAQLNITATSWNPTIAGLSAAGMPLTIATNDEKTFSLLFAPESVGEIDSTFTIVSNAKSGARQEIHVHGVGVAESHASVTPAQIDFGNVATGTTKSATITVHNEDDVPLVITNGTVSVGGATFGLTLPTEATVAARGTLDLEASFSPAEPGTFTGQADIRVRRSDAPSATPKLFSVSLAGRSLPAIQVDPTSIAFGDQRRSSRTQATVTITNVGFAPLEVQTITLSSATRATVTLVEPVPASVTLQPQSSVTVGVVYQPVPTQDTSADTGTLVITSSDAATPTVEVPITAQCTNCSGSLNECAANRTCDCGVQSTCSNGGCIPARRVFVSKTMTTAALGGVAGADALCNSYASDAELGGTWKAFLVDVGGTPASRFATASVPYALVDGTVIANDWAGFASSSHLHGISADECGAFINNAEVWTGISSPSSTYGSDSCTNFTATSGSYAEVGLTTRADSGWYNVYIQFCDRGNVRIYCVEQ